MFKIKQNKTPFYCLCKISHKINRTDGNQPGKPETDRDPTGESVKEPTGEPISSPAGELAK